MFRWRIALGVAILLTTNVCAAPEGASAWTDNSPCELARSLLLGHIPLFAHQSDLDRDEIGVRVFWDASDYGSTGYELSLPLQRSASRIRYSIGTINALTKLLSWDESDHARDEHEQVFRFYIGLTR
jgi:hypothetical protein